jgi:hypothetical protein
VAAAWILTFWLFAVGWFCCRCVEDATPPCKWCSADADTLSCTLAGFTNRDCNCAFLNATFILTRRSYNACQWYSGGLSEPCAGHTNISYHITADARIVGGSVVGWFVTLIFGEDSAATEITFLYYSGSPTFDCTADHTPAKYSSADFSQTCYHTSATCFLT